MLVLSRKIGEHIIINENEINLVILSINNNRVRLGINADKNIKILRGELYDNQPTEPTESATPLK